MDVSLEELLDENYLICEWDLLNTCLIYQRKAYAERFKEAFQAPIPELKELNEWLRYNLMVQERLEGYFENDRRIFLKDITHFKWSQEEIEAMLSGIDSLYSRLNELDTAVAKKEETRFTPERIGHVLALYLEFEEKCRGLYKVAGEKAG